MQKFIHFKPADNELATQDFHLSVDCDTKAVVGAAILLIELVPLVLKWYKVFFLAREMQDPEQSMYRSHPEFAY